MLKDPDEDTADYTGEVPASRILAEIGKLIGNMDLLRTLPEGYSLWRARPHKENTVEWGAEDLGTAPKEFATQANRMSPAGIPMFYGSEDLETALKEVAPRTTAGFATAGLFKTDRQRTVIDFTQLDPVPSVFDRPQRGKRRDLIFLHDFVEQLKKPARSTHEQIDYVPTQVLTEYLLKVFLDGQVVVGLLYPSAQTDGVSAVLEVSHDHCIEMDAPAHNDEQLCLRLEPGSKTTVSVPASPT